MWSQSEETQAQASKSPKVTAVARLVTFISLAISLVIMKLNHSIGAVDGVEVVFIDYKKISSYKYMFACIVVGLAYNLFQTPFATYYAIKGKRLINNSRFIQFDFYGDKVILCILATGVGAGFGVTTDLKRITDYIKDNGGNIGSKFDEFYNITYGSASLLLIGFISSGIYSITSSLALSKGE